MFRQQIASIVRRAIALAVADGKISLEKSKLETILSSINAASIEIAGSRHGVDFSSGICFRLASEIKLEPSELAATVLEYIRLSQDGATEMFKATLSTAKLRGFLDFEVTELGLCECLRVICATGSSYGRDNWEVDSVRQTNDTNYSHRAQYKQLRLILPVWKDSVDKPVLLPEHKPEPDVEHEPESKLEIDSESIAPKVSSGQSLNQSNVDADPPGFECLRPQSCYSVSELEQRRCLVFARALGRLMKFMGFEVTASFEGDLGHEYLSEFMPNFKNNNKNLASDSLGGIANASLSSAPPAAEAAEVSASAVPSGSGAEVSASTVPSGSGASASASASTVPSGSGASASASAVPSGSGAAEASASAVPSSSGASASAAPSGSGAAEVSASAVPSGSGAADASASASPPLTLSPPSSSCVIHDPMANTEADCVEFSTRGVGAVGDVIIAPIERRAWANVINKMGAPLILTQKVSYSSDKSEERADNKNGSELKLPLFRTQSDLARRI